MSAAVQSNTEATSQWVTFHLGEETYGVNVMQVQEVLRVTEIAPVPGAPAYVLGIINLRGNVVSVLDTRNRFALSPKETTDSSRIIIIEVSDQTVGILVDSVAEVENVVQTEVDAAPNVGNDDSSRYISGVVSRPNGILILVDLDNLLSHNEWMKIHGE